MSQETKVISEGKFDVIYERYKRSLETLNDPNELPVSVFDPLDSHRLKDLELIRQVSAELQKKKEVDMKNAAAKAAELAKLQKKETAAAKEEEPKEE